MTILSDYFDDGSLDAGAHAIENFHYFDEPHRRILGDIRADVSERRGRRGSGAT